MKIIAEFESVKEILEFNKLFSIVGESLLDKKAPAAKKEAATEIKSFVAEDITTINKTAEIEKSAEEIKPADVGKPGLDETTARAELRALLAELDIERRRQIPAILKKYGVKKLPELKVEDLAAFRAEAEAVV